ILLNDWPYGNEKGICKSPGYQFLILLSGMQKSDCKIDHIVVWTKASIETCPPLGDLTPASRQLIQDYVSRTFSALVGDGNVLWFKNWASIQSVRSVEHIHVLVRNPTEEQLARW